jgi:hypothetical protein
MRLKSLLISPWTWAEYRELVNGLMFLIRDLPHPCATIVDVTKMGSLPRDGNIIQILMNVDKTMPDNVFASVIVGAPYGVMVFMNMLTKLSPRAKRMALFTPSRDEAYEQIMARYERLKTDHPS